MATVRNVRLPDRRIMRLTMSGKSKARPREPVNIDDLKARLEMLESRLHVAKIAYLNGTALDGSEVTYEVLNKIANEYIQTSYAIQKIKFGAIKLRMSVAKLLR
jgi:hypothetical protein